MDNDTLIQLYKTLDEAVVNEREICVCMRNQNGSHMAIFVPGECNYNDGIYISAQNNGIVDIKTSNASISYDEMEDEYEIQSGDVTFSLSLI